ncbi:MAG: ABC transporter ATP-binding protein [Methanomassiliicoccales archaeon]
MSDEVILEIEDLYINFYTKAGVVKAIDGVNLTIRKGETFGLVGESGCGKSVTANSIMGLVQSPPGKIEKGVISFETPKEIRARADQKRFGRKENPDAETYRKDRIDILKLNKKDIRLIRGRAISMIFQEPMSALNPVFTAGDQIAEIILLHERKELAEAVLKKLEDGRKPKKKYKKATRKVGNKGEFRCSNCNGIVLDEQEICTQCDSSFVRNPGGRKVVLGYGFYKNVYSKMAADPEDRTLALMAKVPLLRRYRRLMIKEANEKALRMLRLVRIPDPKNVMKSFPHELSGGMQQRVMIAIALSCRPQLLIADEPTTALDVTIQAQILKLIQELQEEMGTSVLMITHNLGIVAEVCDRVGVMYAGCMVERADTESVFKEPLHPYTQGLMNSIPKVDLDLTRLETIEGNVPNLIKPPSGCRFHTRCPYVMEHCKIEKPPLIEIKPGHSVACHLYGGVDFG